MVDLQQHLEEIHQLNAEVIGVTYAGTAGDMVARFGLTFPMLTDADGDISRRYEAYNEVLDNTRPATFVIDDRGVIREKFAEQLNDSVPVLTALRELVD